MLRQRFTFIFKSRTLRGNDIRCVVSIKLEIWRTVLGRCLNSNGELFNCLAMAIFETKNKENYCAMQKNVEAYFRSKQSSQVLVRGTWTTRSGGHVAVPATDARGRQRLSSSRNT